ncbi:MAG TPA: endopeptidase La, partial [Acidimicrobiales bacterium]
HGWIRTWIDTVLELPWGTRTPDHLDLTDARAVLDADHTGLDEVKERIVEFLAVRRLRAERGLDDRAPANTDDGASDDSTPTVDDTAPQPKGSARRHGAIITLVGPPGVGKTSLGESVARALGRSFVRVALGGVRDEAEIRGHRRTYVGAQPGRIVRALAEAGSMNPVFLLDEVDKVGADWRGDPSSALLEVLDPAQNHAFRDHYLEVDLDLSDVLFIATANVLDTIPGPLLDRMEIVRLDGYTDDEKVSIARDHLLPRQEERNGLRPDEVTVDEPALRAIATGHTHEAGVRSLERQLGKLLRKVAVKVAAGEPTPISVGSDDVTTYLGRPTFVPEVAERTAVPGVATGLAVTGAGGDVLFVETSAMPLGGDGEPSLTVTGQLGDVMKESAQIALSYVRSHLDALGIEPGAERRRFHVHFPAGAVPKDGPSAGIAMTTALVSLLTGRPVRPEVAMTGEVTLQGRVLPIGGVKQKVLAAHRAGITEVILPARNGPDLDDVPEAVREALTFHLADDVADVVRLALAPAASDEHAVDQAA